jgi:hypothetical protein
MQDKARAALEALVDFTISQEHLILRASISKHACMLLIPETEVLFRLISYILDRSVVQYHLQLE